MTKKEQKALLRKNVAGLTKIRTLEGDTWAGIFTIDPIDGNTFKPVYRMRDLLPVQWAAINENTAALRKMVGTKHPEYIMLEQDNINN